MPEQNVAVEVGSVSAWSAWKKYPEFTAQLGCLMRNPLHLNETDMKCIEAFITFMYTNQRDECDINQARKILFCQRGRAIENIPRTKAALIEHIKRSTYQGAICWGQCLVANQQLPCPSDWGWLKGTVWLPNWTTLPDASITCRELLKCSCKNNCQAKCRCPKAGLSCAALCSCGSKCLLRTLRVIKTLCII